VPFADSSRAIGAVTQLLVDRIVGITKHNVTVGRSEPPSGSSSISNPRLNLFLFEAQFDPHLRNVALDEGQEPPLWLVLRFLITPFDDDGESDTAAAHRILGDGLRALQSVAYVPLAGLSPQDMAALKPNPEPLKISFHETSVDLLSKLMQGTDEKYRFSMAFEIRPIMIAPASPAAYSLLIGVDYTQQPAAERADLGQNLVVEPSLGPVIESVSPTDFQAGDAPVRLEGQDLEASGIKVQLGPVELPLDFDGSGRPQFNPSKAKLDGASISAGSHPLTVFRTLPGSKKRRSNMLVANLLPHLGSVVRVAPANAGELPELELSGFHLGGTGDDVVVALYQSGDVLRSFDHVTDAPPSSTGAAAPPAQTKRRVKLTSPPIPAGKYNVIVRVNGQQARQSPEVMLP
jgi:hypothetical protein